MRRLKEWFQMLWKNKPQFGALSGGVSTLFVTGMAAGSTMFNIDQHKQFWMQDQSEAVILLVSIIFYVGAIVGAIGISFAVNQLLKKTLSRIYLVLVATGCTLLVIDPVSVTMVALARVALGLAHGAAFVVVLVHGSEVSVKQTRGLNMAALSFFHMVGIVTQGVIRSAASYAELIAPYRIIGIVGLICTVLGGLLSLMLLRESPVFFIQKDRKDEALEAMMKLRNESRETTEIRNDFDEFEKMLLENKEKSVWIFKDGNLRPLLLVVLCKLATVLSFNMAVNVIRLNIFDQEFALEDVSVAAAVVFAIRISVGLLFLFLIDSLGRRMLLMVSTAIGGTVLTVMGIAYLASYYVDSVVGASFMIIYEVAASAGLCLIPDVYCSEAFSSEKKRGSIATVLVLESLMQMAISLVVFWWDFGQQEYYGGVLMFCGLLLVALAIVFYRYLPETSKMSIRESSAEFLKPVERRFLIKFFQRIKRNSREIKIKYLSR